MASRRKSRILAFQALYWWEASYLDGPHRVSAVPPKKTSIEELVSFSWLEEEKRSKMDEGTSTFSVTLIAGTIENIKKIDKIIKKHLENWDISRINRVDLAVLRMSVYSLMFQTDISPSIVIDEAIGICREFGSDDSFRFINGVLDSIRKTLQNKIQEKKE